LGGWSTGVHLTNGGFDLSDLAAAVQMKGVAGGVNSGIFLCSLYFTRVSAIPVSRVFVAPGRDYHRDGPIRSKNRAVTACHPRSLQVKQARI
jgi:hypothetical protein